MIIKSRFNNYCRGSSTTCLRCSLQRVHGVISKAPFISSPVLCGSLQCVFQQCRCAHQKKWHATLDLKALCIMQIGSFCLVLKIKDKTQITCKYFILYVAGLFIFSTLNFLMLVILCIYLFIIGSEFNDMHFNSPFFGALVGSFRHPIPQICPVKQASTLIPKNCTVVISGNFYCTKTHELTFLGKWNSIM